MVSVDMTNNNIQISNCLKVIQNIQHTSTKIRKLNFYKLYRSFAFDCPLYRQ